MQVCVPCCIASDQRLHVNEQRTHKEQMNEPESPAPKSPAQQQAEWVERKTRESYARFLESFTNDPNAEGAPEDDLESIEGQKKKQGLRGE